MQAVTFCPGAELAMYDGLVEHVRGVVEAAAATTPDWPLPWVAADQFTHKPGSTFQLGLGRLLVLDHEIALPGREGDLVAVLEQARAAKGAERRARLEEAWQICPDPALAELVLRLGGRAPPELKLPKKTGDRERRWIELAPSTDPRALFAAPWPTRWRDAQVRMRALYFRPRSPWLAAAALDFGLSESLPWTSIASQAFWQGLAWFIAGQGDVSQLERLRSLEERVARFVGRSETPATDALGRLADVQVGLPPAAVALVEAMAARAPRAKKPVRDLSRLSLAVPEERQVLADAWLEAGDPRGELIAVQERIASGASTPELVEQERALLRAHAAEWCPASLWVGSCVWRRGVPAEGYLKFRSNAELRSLQGSRLLATVERLIARGELYGRLDGAVVADVARSLPSLRVLFSSDEAAVALAQGEPTRIEHLGFDGRRAVRLDGPGLPDLVRIDVGQWRPSWLRHAWMKGIRIIGVTEPEVWAALRAKAPDKTIALLPIQDPLDSFTPAGPSPWELHALGDEIEAVPRAGSTAATLSQALADLSPADRARVKAEVDVEAIARLGMSLEALPR